MTSYNAASDCCFATLRRLVRYSPRTWNQDPMRRIALAITVATQ
jgi:hypothetical protein